MINESRYKFEDFYKIYKAITAYHCSLIIVSKILFELKVVNGFHIQKKIKGARVNRWTAEGFKHIFFSYFNYLSWFILWFKVHFFFFFYFELIFLIIKFIKWDTENNTGSAVAKSKKKKRRGKEKNWNIVEEGCSKWYIDGREAVIRDSCCYRHHPSISILPLSAFFPLHLLLSFSLFVQTWIFL